MSHPVRRADLASAGGDALLAAAAEMAVRKAPGRCAEPKNPTSPSRLSGRVPITVTPVLVVGIASCYALLHMHCQGDLQGDMLLATGALYGPATTGGEWWRLFTALFLHVGLLHLVFNLAVLWYVGRAVERLLGPGACVIVFLAAGVAGGLVGLAVHPLAISAGASGGIFGLLGALIGGLIGEDPSARGGAARRLRSNAITFVVVNFVFSLGMPAVDLAAHAGGLVMGLLCGYAWCTAGRAGAKLRMQRLGGMTAVAAALLVVGGAALPRHTTDTRAQLEHVDQLRARAFADYQAVHEQWQQRQVSDQHLAAVIRRQVLPTWDQARELLQRLGPLDDEHRQRVELVHHCMSLRRESWQLLADAAESGSSTKLQQHRRLWEQAQIVLAQLN